MVDVDLLRIHPPFPKKRNPLSDVHGLPTLGSKQVIINLYAELTFMQSFAKSVRSIPEARAFLKYEIGN
jgi:hypothetical protein